MNLAELQKSLVCLDFETFYDTVYSLRKLSTADYVRDPRFEVIGVGVSDCGKGAVWLETEEFVAWSATVDWSSRIVLAHNTPFDAAILSWKYGFKPGFLLDTLSMAHVLHPLVEVGGSLGALMKFYGLGEKGDEVVRAIGKRRKNFTPEEWQRYGEYCKGDVTGTLKLFFAMMERYGFPESELALIDTTLRMFTEPALKLDEPLLQQFLVEEKQRKADLLTRSGVSKEDLMSNDKFARLLMKAGQVPGMKMSPRTKRETYAFAKTDPAMQALLESEDDEVRWLAEARLGVKSTINETRAERLARLGKSGIELPIFLKYAGAHTFRWSGGDKMNFQNFQRGGTLRKALVAPEGHVVVAGDSSQIEARMNAWLAGHEDLVDAFRQDRDVYSEFASIVYGRRVDRKAREEDKAPGFVGKVSVLGLGYGMGWAKFAMTLLAGGMGQKVTFTSQDAEKLCVNVELFASDPVFSSRVKELPSLLGYEALLTHCAVCHYVVQRYRETNAPIPRLWKSMDQVIRMMTWDAPYDVGPIATVRHGIKLPNGLTMRYPGLEEEENRWSYMGGRGGKERVKLYGGLLTENVVQALARIVVGDQMQALREKYGYKVVMMTHDEIVLCVPEADAEQATKNMLTVMKAPPAWAPDLPLSAEVGFAKSYGEAK